MLKNIIFTACERVLSGEDNKFSLISVLENFILTGSLAQSMPPHTGLPFQWFAVALWNRPEKIDAPTFFESRVQLFAPDEFLTMDATAEFEVSNENNNYRNNFQFSIFPMGLQGTYRLLLSLRKKGENDWASAAEYPIEVTHAVKVVSELKASPRKKKRSRK